MNKQKSKYFSTALLMDEALIYLLEKKEIRYITVKEICQKAGVNRSTFYLHYETIDDLIEETLTYINKKFIDYFNISADVFIRRIEEAPLEELKLIKSNYLLPYLTFIKENKNIFRAAFSNPKNMNTYIQYNSLKKHIFFPILERFDVSEQEREFLLDFYIKGIMAVIKNWVQGNCKEDISYIEKLIIKYVEKY